MWIDIATAQPIKAAPRAQMIFAAGIRSKSCRAARGSWRHFDYEAENKSRHWLSASVDYSLANDEVASIRIRDMKAGQIHANVIFRVYEPTVTAIKQCFQLSGLGIVHGYLQLMATDQR